MIGLSELLAYAVLFVPIFLMHELFHIKSQGLLTTGKIFIHTLWLDCSPDKINNMELLWYGGGVLTSIYLFLAAILINGNPFTWAFLTLGWTQLIYGILEGYYHGIGKWRYLIYALILLGSVYVQI
jgi:hypothetical protein